MEHGYRDRLAKAPGSGEKMVFTPSGNAVNVFRFVDVLVAAFNDATEIL
jgi:hypothetical protein